MARSLAPGEISSNETACSGLRRDRAGGLRAEVDSPAPARPDQASAITIELLRDILVIARQQYDHVIADTPPGFTAEVIATIDSSSDLVMVGTLDSLSLKNTKLGLETLSLMDYDERKISSS